jgi:hypothetical protein
MRRYLFCRNHLRPGKVGENEGDGFWEADFVPISQGTDREGEDASAVIYQEFGER